MDITPTSLQPANVIGGSGQGLSAPVGGAPLANFQRLLQQKSNQHMSPTKAEKQARDGAAGLVSEALILPVLKQVRQSSLNKDGPFSPGIGEKAFGPEFDMQLADRIAQSPNLGVKKALVQRLIKRGQPAVVPGVHKGLNVHG